MNHNQTLSLAPTGRRDAFIAEYGRHFGARRVELIVKSGRWMVEDHAEGAHIVDTDGRRYLDFFVSSGVFNLGHRHPAIMARMRAALETREFGNLLYFSEPKGELARLLARSAPGGLEVVLPTVSGSEAIDLALKLAMGFTGRQGVIHFDNSYHGSTGYSTAMGPSAVRSWAGIENRAFRQLPYGDIAALRGALDEGIAAVVVEPVRSNFDGLDPGPAFFAELRRLCDATGALMIVDEVVTGMGRLGTLWGAEHNRITPDIMVAAKGLSGGVFPLGAVLMRPAIIDCWTDHPYRSFSTYAWSNVGVEVAIAALEETRKILPAANAAGGLLEEALGILRRRHPGKITSVRRVGLIFAIDFNPERLRALEFATALYGRGVIIPPAAISMPTSPIARLLPPLILAREHVEEFLDKADDALGTLG
ncbi:MAG: aspartate aminotransferase family protein [Rhodobacteraceae bacterium]|nr:aspartate aminotransferase family protein [Paracoccaceae bacterium]